MSRYLDKIESPEDIKNLSFSELESIAHEIRERLVDVVSVTGGHLASSLGAVELAIALHYVFDSPHDKIIWDVGHQAYAHKLLTGRNKSFKTLRTAGGVGGFPRRSESEHDPFGAGHASTAVSAAMGMVAARDALGGDEKVIAVVGDGSLTGGLCYEALNNAGHRAKNLIVILNDNEMSISRNVGAISTYLNKVITSSTYNRIKADMQTVVKSIPAIGQRVFDTVRRLEESLKNLVAPGIIFEELGFRYFGPIDGHDVRKLVAALRRLSEIDQPMLLHILTRKGKGYVHAEQHPEYFHGTSPFDIDTGNAAMTSGTGLDGFAKEFPKRFFDVGIAEEHAVVFAAGLAASGCKPVVAMYATFLQRAYDQIVHDVCAQRLPVTFAVDRGGIVGADGATHSGQFALSYLRHIPNLVVMEPACAGELDGMLECAIEWGKPAAIVYPKASSNRRSEPGDKEPIELGKAHVLSEG
ncbi:MAG: 1-deoxy-D-xylulose-5-phosphate synthase, partial [bacterium]